MYFSELSFKCTLSTRANYMQKTDTGNMKCLFSATTTTKNQHAVLSTVTCPIIHLETEHSFGTHCSQNGSGADLMIPN